MELNQLISDDRQRAPKSRLISAQFMRTLGYTWHFRRLLLTGFASAMLFAALHAASLAGALPVLKLILDEEGLHGWIDRTVASRRLGFEVELARRSESPVLTVRRISPHHPLYAEGLGEGDILLPDPLAPAEWLASVARRPEGDVLSFDALRVAPGRSASGDDRHAYRVTLQALDLKESAKAYLAGLLSRETLEHDKFRVLVIILASITLMAVVANSFRFLAEYLVSQAVLHGMIRLRARLYEKVLQLPMSFFTESGTSDLVTQFVQDIQEIQRGLLALFGKLVTEPLKAGFILALAVMLDARLTLMVLLIAPLAAGVFLLIGRQVRKANRKLLQQYGVMIGGLSTVLQAIDIVKAYTTEDFERRRLDALDAKMFTQQRRIARMQAALPPALEVLAVSGVSIVCVWLGSRVLQRQLNVSEFMQLALVLGMMLDPIRKVADVYTRISRGSAGADRIFKILDLPPESLERGGDLPVAPLRTAIELRGVTFTYAGATAPALRDVSLRIAGGECIALVGPNGSGKTTLVNLLLRFYDAQHGEVRYDDHRIEEYRLPELRAQIALVTQKSVVFDGTIRENIAYGSPQAAEPQIRDAARRAFAEEFILARPHGYDERVGESGSTLSGGQRQRLVIARAILRNAPILIFDEATSQVDTESDEKIHHAIRELARNRTTIMIAHRPSTFRFADRIVVMEGGRIVDEGRHEELIVRCPLYRTLCQAGDAPFGTRAKAEAMVDATA